MKHVSKLLVVLCIAAVSVGAAAVTSTSTVISPPMKDFFSLDGQHLWALIQNNQNREFLFSTTDGGASWKAFPLPYLVWRVFFIDRVEGWGIAAEPDGSTVKTFCVHTSDSGRTWQRLSPLSHGYEHPTGIAFDNKEHGWVVGEGYAGVAFVFETIDGGKHWRRLDWKTEPASGLYGVRVHDGVAFTWSGGAGGSGIFELRRGALPKRISNRETMNFAFISDHAIVSTSQVAVSLRGGQSGQWVQVLEASDSTLRDMSFVDSANGCVAGGEIYCTDDGGRTWTPRPQPRKENRREDDYVERLYLINPARGWAVSGDAIFETNDGGHTWRRVSFFDGADSPMTHVRKD